MSQVPAQMRQCRAQSRCRCARAELSLGADVAGPSSVPAQMWQRCPLPDRSLVGIGLLVHSVRRLYARRVVLWVPIKPLQGVFDDIPQHEVHVLVESPD